MGQRNTGQLASLDAVSLFENSITLVAPDLHAVSRPCPPSGCRRHVPSSTASIPVTGFFSMKAAICIAQPTTPGTSLRAPVRRA
jgi:hypothetical protein